MSINNPLVPSWFDARKGKLTYSMLGSRNGTDGTADCSGSTTQAIRDAGGLPYDYLYSTVTLGGYLSRNGYVRITQNREWDAKQGDILMMSWGADMSTSGGAGGHVGVMKDAWTFISVDYWTGGQAGTAVSEHNVDSYLNIQGPTYFEAWRLSGETSNPTPKPPAQNNNKFKYAVGTKVKFGGVFASSDQASKANPNNGYTPANKLARNTGTITKQLKTNGVDTYLIDNGFGWINNGDVHTNNPTPAPSPSPAPTAGRIAMSGTFIPNQSLPVSADTDPNSPEVARYQAGQPISYDSYISSNGYVWISYIAASGTRRYVAVGPDDNRTDTTWGTGFFN